MANSPEDFHLTIDQLQNLLTLYLQQGFNSFQISLFFFQSYQRQQYFILIRQNIKEST